MFSNRSLGDVAVDGIANLRLEALRGISVFSNRKAASPLCADYEFEI